MKIGIAGFGTMGSCYATTLIKEIPKDIQLFGSDVPEKVRGLRGKFGDSVTFVGSNSELGEICDAVISTVPMEGLDGFCSDIKKSLGKKTIIWGAASVKTHEKKMFDKYFLPKQYQQFHSFHGDIDPKGKDLATIESPNKEEYQQMVKFLSLLGSNMTELKSAEDHDRLTADPQGATHFAQVVSGTTWMKRKVYPWLNGSYVGRTEYDAKIANMMRVLSGNVHVIRGLAMYNPFVQEQVEQFTDSSIQLFDLACNDRKKFLEETEKTRDYYLNLDGESISLSDDFVKGLELGEGESKPNSQLSQWTIAHTWMKLGINPLANKLCRTPPLKLKIGIVDALMRNDSLCNASTEAALNYLPIREDDRMFTKSARQWRDLIVNKDVEGYARLFEETRDFFKVGMSDKFEQGINYWKTLISKL